MKNKIIKLLFFIIFSIILNNNLLSQSLNFYREKIIVELQDEFCIIKGTYYLKNSSFMNINCLLYYPFIINNEMSFPHKIKITNLKNQNNISFKSDNNGIYFSVNVLKDSISIYQIIYHQKIKNNRMEYILTTTEKWGKPFEYAEYIYKMPINYEVKYTSILPDETVIEGNTRILKCNKINFMPTKNLIIEWEKNNEK